MFDGNLAVLVRASSNMLTSDLEASCFWTSSPMCFWHNNVAVGCERFGFWFELGDNPTGASYTTTVCPVNNPLGGFFNNSAHSSGFHGMHLYPQWIPLVEPCTSVLDAQPSPQYLYNFTSWRNAGRGVSCNDNGNIHHINYNLVENGDDDFTWHLLETPNMTFVQESLVQNLLAVGSINPNGLKPGDAGGFFGPANEFMMFGPATFVNYGGGVLRSCLDCGDELTDVAERQGYVVGVGRGGASRG